MKNFYLKSLWYLLLLVVFGLTLSIEAETVDAETLCDANGDGKIGLEEAIFALQVVTGRTGFCIDNLECSAPPSGKTCIAGQLVDTENNLPIENDSTIQIVFYDALAFAQNPAGTSPLPGGSTARVTALKPPRRRLTATDGICSCGFPFRLRFAL